MNRTGHLTAISVLGRLRDLLRSNALIYLVGSIASRLGAIVLIPIYTRCLTAAEYGELALANSVLQVLPMCTTLGLNGGMTRVYFGNQDRDVAARELGAVARGMLMLSWSILGVVAIGIYAFVGGGLFGIQKRNWLLLLVASAGHVAVLVPQLYFRAAQRPIAAVVVQVGQFTLTAGLGVGLVLLAGRSLQGAMEALAFSLAAMGAYGTFFIFRGLPAGHVTKATRSALGYSVALIPHFVASWGQQSADRWVLTAFGASAELGRYYLASQLALPVLMLIGAWNDSEVAKHGEVYRERGASGAYSVLPKLYKQYFLVGLASAFAILICSPLLPFVVGHRFVGALSLLPLVALAYVIDAFYYPASNYVFYAGHTKWIPVVTGGAGIASIGMAIVLLGQFGIMGLLASRVCASVLRSGGMMLAARLVRPPAAPPADDGGDAEREGTGPA